MNTRYVEFAETTAPAPGLSGEVRIFVDSSTGEVSAKKDNGTVVSLETPSAGGSFAAFQDAETPSGTINGSNDTFTLATAPSPASSLVLTKNGIVTGIRLGLHVELCHDYVSGRSRTAKRRQSAGLVPHRRFGRGRRSDGELPESGGFGNSRDASFPPTHPPTGSAWFGKNSSSQWIPKECARVNDSLQWHFAGTPSTGTQSIVLSIPEGVTNVSLVDSRISINSTGGATDYNIERCISNCTLGSATFSNIYSTDPSISTGRRSEIGGTPTSTTAAAGDQFRVSFSTVGSGVADVTVSLTYQHTAVH